MTAELDRGLAALRSKFAADIASGLIVHLGTYNCRTKNNQPDGPWSEHAWPNAVDVMLKCYSGTRTPTPAAKAVGYELAAWMRANPTLWSEVFWQIAAHYDHVHGTATPRRNYDNEQVPPCAGGPGGDDDVEEVVKGIQRSLNAAGFKGANGAVLTVDGVWGTNTEFAFTAMTKAAKATSTGGVTLTQVNAAIATHAKVKPSSTVHPHRHDEGVTGPAVP